MTRQYRIERDGDIQGGTVVVTSDTCVATWDDGNVETWKRPTNVSVDDWFNNTDHVS